MKNDIIVAMISFLKPDIIYDSSHVTSITVDDLKSLNVNVLVLDLDNTIMAPKSGIIGVNEEKWLNEMRKSFQLFILSNNKKPHYLKHVENILNIPVIGFAKKPWSEGINKILKSVNISREKICVIGDRPLTDIWLAKRFGLKSILVRPLTGDFEPRWKFYLRKVEWSFIKKT